MIVTDVKQCTRFTARCKDARDYDVELRDCCRGHVIQMVRDIQRLFDKEKMRWWADYGTLLGAVRNPMTSWSDYPWLSQERTTSGPSAGIVPHDKDADLGAMFSEWEKVRRVRPKLIELGYNVKLDGLAGKMKVRLSQKNTTNVDVFFWREKPLGVLFRQHYAKVDSCKGREFPKAMLGPKTTVEWEGMKLPAPADPEAFLEMRYGSNWRTPVMANHDGIAR